MQGIITEVVIPFFKSFQGGIRFIVNRISSFCLNIVTYFLLLRHGHEAKDNRCRHCRLE